MAIRKTHFANIVIREDSGTLRTVSGANCSAVSRGNVKGEEHRAMCMVDGAWHPIHSVSVSSDVAVDPQTMRSQALGHWGAWLTSEDQISTWCTGKCNHGHTVEKPHWSCCGSSNPYGVCKSAATAQKRKRIKFPAWIFPSPCSFEQEITSGSKGVRTIALLSKNNDDGKKSSSTPYVIDQTSFVMAYSTAQGVLAKPVVKRQLSVIVFADTDRRKTSLQLPFTFKEFCRCASMASGILVRCFHVCVGEDMLGRKVHNEASYSEMVMEVGDRSSVEEDTILMLHSSSSPRKCPACRKTHWCKNACRRKLFDLAYRITFSEKQTADGVVASLESLSKAICAEARMHTTPESASKFLERADQSAKCMLRLSEYPAHQQHYIRSQLTSSRMRMHFAIDKLRDLATGRSKRKSPLLLPREDKARMESQQGDDRATTRRRII